MSIEATFDEERAEVVVSPAHGKRVVFVVETRTFRVRGYTGARRTSKWTVGLRGSAGEGFSSHSSFEAACRSLLYRARRYDRAYSVPRGIAS